MKKAFWWIGAILLTPVVLFVILAILLYLPPVQNWAVDKVTAMVSEDTGMDISIDRVCLVFPLDLGVEGIKVLRPTTKDSKPTTTSPSHKSIKKDTIADIRRVVANVELMPLIDGTLVVKKMEVAGARFNTSDMIEAAKVKGSLGLLSIRSDGISLSDSKALLNGAKIDRAVIDVALADSVPEDTTKSENIWAINADKITLTRSEVTIHTPGDTMSVKAGISSLTVDAADINLGTQQYRVGRIEWKNGCVYYDNNMEEATDGLDPNHIALTDINITADSILYSEDLTHAVVRNMSMKEKSGLQLSQLYTSVTMDKTDIDIPTLLLRTPSSELNAKAKVSLKVADDDNPGPFNISMYGSIGKEDVMAFCGNMPKAFIQRYPNHPISLMADVKGDIRDISIDAMKVKLPTAFSMNADGWVKEALSQDKLKAHVNLNARTENLSFITCLLPSDVMDNYRIPYGITAKGQINADGSRYGADLTIAEGKGRIKAKGNINTKSEAYDANLDISDIDVRHFMPRDSIGIVSANVNAEGRGFDIFNKRTTLNAGAAVTRLDFGSDNLNNFTAKATVADGKGEVNINGSNHLLDGSIDLYALIDKKNIDATVAADIMRVDLHQMRVTDKPMTIGVCMHADLASDLKQSHKAEAIVNDLTIITEDKTYRPADITLRMKTNPDTTIANIQSGNLLLRLNAKGGYESLMTCGERITQEMSEQFKQRIIDNNRIKEILPDMQLYLKSGNSNPVANFLRMYDIDFNSIYIDLKSSPTDGLNGNGQLYSLVMDSTRIDTIRFDVYQDSLATRIKGQVCNNKRNPQFVFNALFDGYVYANYAGANIKYYDGENKLGLDLGAKAEMADSGINIHLEPYTPILGYKAFNVNKDNYLFMAQSGRLSANLDMIADDGAGIKVYSDDSDSELMQDITVSLNRFDLGKITSVMPYMPSIDGLLGGDYHIVQTPNGKFSVMSDMSIRQLAYEKSLIGNIGTEFVYMQREDDAHYVEARINKDDNEIGVLNGSYQAEGDGYLDALFTMTQFPLDVINGFIPDQIIGLEGAGDGQLAVKGPLSQPVIDGEVLLTNSYLVSVPYGVRLRFDDDPVRIDASRLLFENFTIYANNSNPLIIHGDLDFSNLDAMRLDLKMKADNYQIIDSKYNSKSISYGKAFVNFAGQISGLMSNLTMRGKLDVLGKTDMTYILRDSPLNTDDQLKGLVQFVNFNDSLSDAVNRPPVSGLDMLLMMNIEQGARIRCDLNADRSNYVEVEGGGELRMTYNTLDNMQLFGRYTINEGEMKYELPVIPLKTFNIAKGSYVEFTGDIMNPRLDIEATEEVKALVSAETGSSRSVLFNCGVKVTKTLNDMGLEFTLDAPKDMTVKNELAAMSLEQRGRVAVTMLSTGMYLTDGNTSSFSMNSALNAFLQSEINSITSNAMKTVDISLGVDNTSDEAGNAHTDYSFKFAKRFWNNRFNFIIGGKLTDNSNSMSNGQDNTFIDNVSLEYRLDQTAMRYVRLFYNKEADDLLEDKISEYGAGYVWRKKMNSLRDIFRNK